MSEPEESSTRERNYAAKAASIKTLAEQAKTPEAREQLFLIAGLYEKLAAIVAVEPIDSLILATANARLASALALSRAADPGRPAKNECS
jgi:hypothetical protein